MNVNVAEPCLSRSTPQAYAYACLGHDWPHLTVTIRVPLQPDCKCEIARWVNRLDIRKVNAVVACCGHIAVASWNDTDRPCGYKKKSASDLSIRLCLSVCLSLSLSLSLSLFLSAVLQEASDLSQLWYREFFLELTNQMEKRVQVCKT